MSKLKSFNVFSGRYEKFGSHLQDSFSDNGGAENVLA